VGWRGGAAGGGDGEAAVAPLTCMATLSFVELLTFSSTSFDYEAVIAAGGVGCAIRLIAKAAERLDAPGTPSRMTSVCVSVVVAALCSNGVGRSFISVIGRTVAEYSLSHRTLHHAFLRSGADDRSKPYFVVAREYLIPRLVFMGERAAKKPFSSCIKCSVDGRWLLSRFWLLDFAAPCLRLIGCLVGFACLVPWGVVVYCCVAS